MADYFTNFSFSMSLPTVAAQQYALELARQAQAIKQEDEQPDDFPSDLKDSLEDWWFETDADGSEKEPALWLHSDNGGMDAACMFIHHLLQNFDPTGRVEFEWSFDCSKPRTDAYGGGAAIVTAKEIKSMSTFQWLRENAA